MQKHETAWERVPVVFDLPYAATLLNVSLDRIRKLAQRGEFPAFKIGKLWRVNKADMLDYIDRQKVAS
ncbi:helix-turn-helix domain-containing protein [Clostridium sp. KNHs216]|uniref:helix-turn-helix domain-containing protein n=1 Tax=Clostridium sp. KNHs216 TaxID=1550235 RepID=UPI001154D047|nr:helix-turn-helix domain-containing protein [Clostridium sp. KNHs216]TQI66227.1 AlpA family transcriptional regulator [Clostridium sp. KNHs216]